MKRVDDMKWRRGAGEVSKLIQVWEAASGNHSRTWRGYDVKSLLAMVHIDHHLPTVGRSGLDVMSSVAGLNGAGV